jgi:hypothetical protein
MRTVDLAVYADVLAAEATALARRLERARGRLRQAAIEREARASLAGDVVGRLERIGILGTVRERAEVDQIAELAGSLDAIERLQAWVESELAAAERRDAAAAADWAAMAGCARASPAPVPSTETRGAEPAGPPPDGRVRRRASAAHAPGDPSGSPGVAA